MRLPTSWRIAAVGLALHVGLVATVTAGAPAATPRPPVPPLHVQDLDGHTLDLAALTRKGPVVLDFVWDGTSDDGAPQPAGVYLVRATIGGSSIVRRVLRIR